ncbi:hypothetical protein BDU57DRAFT_512502 [Ampelomyces quisqualis]|uniref:Uncharacterized protein n=1 Tax=Ampelomyces quisqualis TaxID=50730 RepID=A0A6A5QVB3_AMPQU|nr:hypothetical protein BDU57DRAFT_512502 [Ampelomyces quisqualis]
MRLAARVKKDGGGGLGLSRAGWAGANWWRLRAVWGASGAQCEAHATVKSCDGAHEREWGARRSDGQVVGSWQKCLVKCNLRQREGRSGNQLQCPCKYLRSTWYMLRRTQAGFTGAARRTGEARDCAGKGDVKQIC